MNGGYGQSRAKILVHKAEHSCCTIVCDNGAAKASSECKGRAHSIGDHVSHAKVCGVVEVVAMVTSANRLLQWFNQSMSIYGVALPYTQVYSLLPCARLRP